VHGFQFATPPKIPQVKRLTGLKMVTSLIDKENGPSIIPKKSSTRALSYEKEGLTLSEPTGSVGVGKHSVRTRRSAPIARSNVSFQVTATFVMVNGK
jgi:hypothetical protein